MRYREINGFPLLFGGLLGSSEVLTLNPSSKNLQPENIIPDQTKVQVAQSVSIHSNESLSKMHYSYKNHGTFCHQTAKTAMELLPSGLREWFSSLFWSRWLKTAEKFRKYGPTLLFVLHHCWRKLWILSFFKWLKLHSKSSSTNRGTILMAEHFSLSSTMFGKSEFWGSQMAKIALEIFFCKQQENFSNVAKGYTIILNFELLQRLKQI